MPQLKIAYQRFRQRLYRGSAILNHDKKTLYLQFGSYKVSQARLKDIQILRAIARCHVVYFRRVKLNKPNCSSLKTDLFIMSHHLLSILLLLI